MEDEDNPQTLKPVYEFEFASGEVRRTDELENDGPHFREEGIELLAAKCRDDPECECTLVGFTEISN